MKSNVVVVNAVLAIALLTPGVSVADEDAHNGRLIRVNVRNPNAITKKGEGPIRAGEPLTVRLININSAQFRYAIKFKIVDFHTAVIPGALKDLIVPSTPSEVPLEGQLRAAPSNVAVSDKVLSTEGLLQQYNAVKEAYASLSKDLIDCTCVLDEGWLQAKMLKPFTEPGLTNVGIRKRTRDIVQHYFDRVSECLGAGEDKGDEKIELPEPPKGSDADGDIDFDEDDLLAMRQAAVKIPDPAMDELRDLDEAARTFGCAVNAWKDAFLRWSQNIAPAVSSRTDAELQAELKLAIPPLAPIPAPPDSSMTEPDRKKREEDRVKARGDYVTRVKDIVVGADANVDEMSNQVTPLVDARREKLKEVLEILQKAQNLFILSINTAPEVMPRYYQRVARGTGDADQVKYEVYVIAAPPLPTPQIPSITLKKPAADAGSAGSVSGGLALQHSRGARPTGRMAALLKARSAARVADTADGDGGGQDPNAAPDTPPVITSEAEQPQGLGLPDEGGTVAVYGRWVLDFGAGLGATTLRKHNFFIGPGKKMGETVVRRGVSDGIDFGAVVMADVYPTTLSGISAGLSFGLLPSGNPRYLIGPSIVLGKKNRVVLTGGWAFGNVPRLNGDRVGSAPRGTALDIQDVMRQGYFFSLSGTFALGQGRTGG